MPVEVRPADASEKAMRRPATRRRAGGATPRTARTVVAPRAAWRAMTAPALRRLAAMPRAGGEVVTVYVSLGPGGFALPAARETAIQSAVDEARAAGRARRGSLDHEAREAVESDLERVHQYLAAHVLPDGPRSLMLIASAPRGLFLPFTLAYEVETQGHAGPAPHLRPLFELPGPPDFAVLALDRRWARLYLSRGGRPLAEAGVIESETRGHREQSGARQARVQRAVDHDTDQHAQLAAALVLAAHRAHHLGALVVACGEEIYPVVHRRLHPYVLPLLLGRIPWDPEQDDLRRLASEASGLLRQRDAAHEEAILDTLAQEIRQGKGALGLAAVLDGLNERRAETLILEHGIEASGALCPGCEYLTIVGESCPACGTSMVGGVDLVEEMVRAALSQAAEVRFLRYVTRERGEPPHVAATFRPA